MRPLFCMTLLLIGLAGCDTASARRAWTTAHGGEIIDAHLARAQAVAARLCSNDQQAPLTFHILASSQIAAYSWPDSSIYLSQGLLDLLNDDELAAAIAHECGHLARQEGDVAIASLRGCDEDLAVEVRADAQGVQLLKANGMSPSVMARMLTKVRNSAQLSNTCRAAIERRIQILSTIDAQ